MNSKRQILLGTISEASYHKHHTICSEDESYVPPLYFTEKEIMALHCKVAHSSAVTWKECQTVNVSYHHSSLTDLPVKQCDS